MGSGEAMWRPGMEREGFFPNCFVHERWNQTYQENRAFLKGFQATFELCAPFSALLPLCSPSRICFPTLFLPAAENRVQESHIPTLSQHPLYLGTDKNISAWRDAAVSLRVHHRLPKRCNPGNGGSASFGLAGVGKVLHKFQWCSLCSWLCVSVAGQWCCAAGVEAAPALRKVPGKKRNQWEPGMLKPNGFHSWNPAQPVQLVIQLCENNTN